MPFYKIEEMEEKLLSSGTSWAKTVPGELMKAGIVTIPEGKGSEPHVHPNEEQFILILEGRRYMIVGDEERIIGPGDLIHIPRNTRHGARTIDEKSVFFTVKSPCGDGDLNQDYNKSQDSAEVAHRLAEKLAQNKPG